MARPRPAQTADSDATAYAAHAPGRPTPTTRPADLWRCATIPPPWGLLTLGLLTLLPGDALYRLLFARARRHASVAISLPAPPFGEQLFLRGFGGVLLVGWWGLTLAEAGAFGLPGVLGGIGAISATLYGLAWRLRGPFAFDRPRPRPSAAGVALAAILLLAGGLFFGRPFETIVGGEDAGIYFSTGGLIARGGALQAPDPGLAAFGVAATDAAGRGAARHLLLPLDGERYRFVDWQRFQGFFLLTDADRPNTITPQFLHLYPTWLALWAILGGGVGAMVYGSAAFALLGVAATALLARRLFGTPVALLAATLLTMNGLQIWFARQSLSEALLQPLLVGALYAWALLVEARDAGDTVTARGAALLAGLALGSVALTHAQFIFALLPIPALLAWLWLARRWQPLYWWFLMPLALLLTHAAFHIARYSLGYFEGIYHHVWLNAVRDWPQTTAMILGPILLLLLVGLRPLRARWLPLATDRRIQRLARRVGAATVLLAGAWLYLIRPGILASGTLAAWAGYVGAPVPLGPASSLVSLGWYLSPPGLLLAFAGLALLALCDFEERAAAVLALTAPFAILYLIGTFTAGGYIYSLRRFMPLIVPVAAILTAYALWQLGPALAGACRRPRLARPLRAVGLGLAALLFGFLGYTNARLVTHREYAGVLDQTRALADRFGPDDIIIFSGPRDETPKLATPLHYLFGRESWVITTNFPDGALLDAWVSRQEAAGRRVHLLLSAGGGKLFLPQHQLVATDHVEVPLLQVEQLKNQKPFNEQTNGLGYTLYGLRPVPTGQNALGALPYRVVAGEADEAAQLGTFGTEAGFYNVERDVVNGTPNPPYRWTDGEALLRIPWPTDGRPLTLRLTLDAGPRPASLPPAQVVVGIRPTPGGDDKERPLTILTVQSGWAEYTVTIPADALDRTEDGTALIHLGMPRIFDGKEWRPAPGATWRPSAHPDATNRSSDSRDLHIRFARAELSVGP